MTHTATERRAHMLALTADLRAKLVDAQHALALNQLAADRAYDENNYCRMVRTTERRHDLSAQIDMLSRDIVQRLEAEAARLGPVAR
jgi:hypothetical protein